ncbi:MAG: PEGA domain-containing protein [bacterium]
MEKENDIPEEKQKERPTSKKVIRKGVKDKTKTHWETRLFPTPVPAWKRMMPYGIVLLVVLVIGYIFLSRHLTPSVGRGSLLITSNPTNAIVYLDEQDFGQTPLEIGDIPVSEYSLRIVKAGYTSYQEKITIPRDGQKRVKAELLESLGSPMVAEAEVIVPPEAELPVPPIKPTLEEITGGGISISSTPSGATVFIDNKLQRETTPLEVANLEPGRHLVKLINQGYKNWEDEVIVENEVISNLEVKLSPLSGGIKITSLPTKAEVYLNEEYKGKTPLTIKDVRGREAYMVRVSAPDYRDWESNVTVEPGQTVDLKANLERMATGALLIASNPKEAKVYVDGELIGRTPLVGVKLEIGERQVRIVKSGYAPVTRTVKVMKENNPLLNFNLEEAKEAKEEEVVDKPASIFITSEPPGAGIYIDGISIEGETPLGIPKIEPGEHRIKVSKVGYLPDEKVVTVHRGESAASNFILKEEKKKEKEKAAIVAGHIIIVTDPPTCKLYLDGKYQGTTPMTISGRRGWEPYEIKLTAEGYTDWFSRVFVGPGQTFPLKAKLEKIKK